MAYAPNLTQGIVRIENLSMITSIGEIDARQVREVIFEKWSLISKLLHNSILLFIAGIHGKEDGTFGDFEDSCRAMMNQVYMICSL